MLPRRLVLPGRALLCRRDDQHESRRENVLLPGRGLLPEAVLPRCFDPHQNR